MGEAAHCCKEFYTSKFRIIKYLAEQHHYRIFVIEDGYTSSLNINKFIQGADTTDIYKLISRNWMGALRTQEVIDMLLWMKKFNANRPAIDRIKVYGWDMKWYTTPAQYFLEELKKSNQLTPELEHTLNFLCNHRKSDKLQRKNKVAVSQLINQLKIISESNHNKVFDFNIAILEQSLRYVQINNTVLSTMYHDEMMAENCKRIFENEGKQKMMVWAHNQHIASHSDVSKKNPMGYHLKKFFGDAYYSLGFSLYTGNVWGYNLVVKKSDVCELGLPKDDCVDNLFADAPYSNFYVSTSNSNFPAVLNEVFNKQSWSRRFAYFVNDTNSKINYRRCVLSQSFDALLFIRNIHAAEMLPYTP